MHFIKDLSIRTKLITMILAINLLTLSVGFGFVMINDYSKFKADMLHDSLINTRLVAEHSVSPLAFSDNQGAEDALSSLKSIPYVINALVYDKDKQLFASYNKTENKTYVPANVLEEGVEFKDNWLHIFQPITYKHEHYGTIYLRASTAEMNGKIADHFVTMLSLAGILSIAAYLLARRLQKLISDPIHNLAEVARQVSLEENYHCSVEKLGRDEIGTLYDAFNDMMKRIFEHGLEMEKMLTQLYAEKEQAQVTLRSIGDAVITTDTEGFVQYLNPIAEQLTGWETCEARDRPLQEVFNIINELTREPTENPVQRCLKEGSIVALANHTLLIRRDGQEIAIEDSAAPIRNEQGEVMGVVMVFHDVTVARKLSQQISYQARHDSLTDLINRREFESRLERVINSLAHTKAEHALLYMDLDQFKVVNDTCGHAAGDELLRQVTSLLKPKVRKRDTLARLGGDEFAVLMEHCTPDQATRLAEEIRETIENYRFIWGNKSFAIGVSVGLVPIHHGSGDITAVLSNADSACYAAKDAGRNRIHHYQEGDQIIAQRHGEMQWVSRINEGLESNTFCLVKQRIVPVKNHSDSEDHFEVLVRLREKDGNLTPPGTFLPAAERYNMATRLDLWVIQNVFDWFQHHPDQAKRISLCSINVSGHSFSSEQFLNFVVDQVDRLTIDPHRICFEVTETATIANLTSAAHFIKTLKSKGCRFALDDFGAGMSSFMYLKNLPVDFIKIDGSFVRNIPANAMDRAMVKSINDIGHVLGMETIAEFVENENVLSILEELGVDYAQGYYIGKPVPM